MKDIYIYSDESGVFDSKHNDIFVFAGVICFGKEEKELLTNNYKRVEETIRAKNHISIKKEIKANSLSIEDKYHVYRSLLNTFKFVVIIKEKELNPNVFENKKHKQRYLDYAYKLALKKAFETIINARYINPKDIKNIYVNCDEHNTATDGIYELRENLLNEFHNGTFSMTYNKFYPPIIPNLENLFVNYCNSAKVTLIRAADIIANHIYHEAITKNRIKKKKGLFILSLPRNKIVNSGLDYFNK